MDKIKQLLVSKKFIVMVAGLIVAGAARYGLNLDPVEVAGILTMFIAFILAQGQADKGKEAAKVEAIASVTADPTVNRTDEARVVKAVQEA